MRPLSPSASQNGSPLALETLGSCLAELAKGPYVKRLLAPCSNQIYHGFAPGSRCVPSVPSFSSFEPLPALVHLTRTAPSPLHLTPASTPAAPRLTSNQPNPTQPNPLATQPHPSVVKTTGARAASERGMALRIHHPESLFP